MYKLIFALAIGLPACTTITNEQITGNIGEVSIYDMIGDSVFRVGNENSWGTGFVMRTKSGKKVIITNDHVCDGMKAMEDKVKEFNKKVKNKKDKKKIKNLIIGTSGGKWRMKVIAKYAEHDLCMLAAPKYAPVLKLAAKYKFREKVFTAGYPSIHDMTTNQGVVLKMDRSTDFPYPLEPKDCKGKKYKLKVVNQWTPFGSIPVTTCFLTPPRLQTSIRSGGGSSGSPVVNEKGEAIGVIMGTRGRLGHIQIVSLKYLRDFLDNN